MAATLPLLVSALKTHYSPLTLLFSVTRSPRNLSFLFKPPPLRRRRFGRNLSAAAISTSAVQQQQRSSSTEATNSESQNASVPTFQQAIQRLQEYWASVGCAIMQCSNTEVGAGTMNPLTYLRVLGPEPWNVAYVEPSIRPDDSRYGENPNRLQRHTQFQVILKPDPGNSQDLFIRSLSALGIDVNAHDIRFVEDNWESPVLGAWGLGWEIWMDGMEITQFTYFQQGVDHFKKIRYADGITYGELFLENEKEMSAYYLEHASVDHVQKHFDFSEEEARSLLSLDLPIPAYDQLLKTSHAFNILDSRGFVGVTERARYFGRMRSLARQCAQLWLKTRESLEHPLGVVSESVNLVCPKELLETAIEKVHDDPRLFVLEIGTEEMPPQDVVNASQQLKDLVLQLLNKQRLNHGEVQVFGTPRRLVVCVESLCKKQTANEVEVRGPPVSKAFDQQGNPTKAAEGFCRRYDVPLDSLFKKGDGKTEYVYAQVKEPARLALEVLSEDVPGIVGKISFPKSMRWNSQVMFSRPIRWIMALHGNVVVPFTFSGILSGNLSYGLRNTPSATVLVESAESYVDVIRNAGISIEIEDRKKTILERSNALAKSVNGNIVVRESLLNEVINLVEAPVPILGKFKESFLELPEDLLTMEKLGTMLDKMIRVENMVTKLSLDLGINENMLQIVQDAASLAMSDLSTAVVTEFTSLSGIMARHYALRDGFSEQIADALLEITLPRFSGDVLPKTDAGTVLSVADRLDSLVGLFAAGCQPSSTNDPFGLRRISYGLVQIMIEKDKNLDLARALVLAADVQPIKVDADMIKDVHQFVTRRLEQFLVDKGISPEVVRSVLAERANLPCLAAKTANKMEALSRGELFPKVVEAYSRPTRIVRGKVVDPAVEVDESAFETVEERALWNAFLSVNNKIHPGIDVDDFVEISALLVQPLEDFFNNVFVMVEEERIRKNRLALLKKIADLPRGIADLSILPGF
ncbi:hypothetical protein Dsin_026519 [Dipteronia sinensis]|uniref:glycine--tRNA ligase n=1 Tax=Dipteronia sinensis TaxID=43782 RepID=A0AAD9ZYU5_9ROSI|nr:hypothetical protein Dsin_026519 [Dipteronia sinensis]